MAEEEPEEVEKPEKKTPTKKAPAEEKTKEEVPVEAPKLKKIVYKKIRLNLWRTRLHAEELGIYQSMKYRAKTKFFAQDFDIEGVVEIDGKKKYIIAFNKKDWEEGEPAQKRLILRLFSILEEKMGVGKGGNFKGGIELSIAHSIIQSVDVKRPSPVFIVHSPRTSNLIRIIKSRRFIGTRWSFPLLPEDKEDVFVVVTAKGVVAPGNDYNINLGKQKIAKVDHQRVTKDVEIEIYDEAYANDKTFVEYLTLFGCICFFMKGTLKVIKYFFKNALETGTSEYKIPKNELDLFKNPRMIRR
jgi:hypothetical protein